MGLAALACTVYEQVAARYQELAQQLLANDIAYDDVLRVLAETDDQLIHAPAWEDCQQEDAASMQTVVTAATHCRDAHDMLLQVMKGISLTHQQEAMQQQQHTRALNAYRQGRQPVDPRFLDRAQ